MATLEDVIERIEKQYASLDNPPVTGFGEILCHEIHENGLTFCWLAEKWGISLTMLGLLISEHCQALEKLAVVNHKYPSNPCPWCNQ